MSYDRDAERQKMRADRRDSEDSFDLAGGLFLVGYFVAMLVGVTIGLYVL